jgi:heme oxygenase
VQCWIDGGITGLQCDVKSAEAKLSGMSQASAVRWKEFEAHLSAATSRVHPSTEKALG